MAMFFVQAALAAAVFLAIAEGVQAGSSELPPGLKACNRNDPDLNACMKDAVTAAFPVVADGIPSFSIASIDPLDIKQLLIGEGTGPVKLNLEFNDVQLLGLRDAYMETINVDLDGFNITGRCKFNGPIRIRGPYKISGSVLVLPISGEGLTNITLNNLISDIIIEGDKVIKGGEEFVKIKSFKLNLTASHLETYFSNLFNGDKALGDTMNKFLNENWQEIYKELEPTFELTLGAIFQQITARVFQKVPFDKIFPK